MSWFAEFGRQLPWRQSDLQPWQVLVVEILLQQTRAERIATFRADILGGVLVLAPARRNRRTGARR
jgi:hypothetical protein